MENETKLEILVIEDKPEHLEQVQKMLERRVKEGCGINPTYVSTYEEAEQVIREKNIDGIISDVFFPSKEGQGAENQAYKMFDLALSSKTPIVYCTDGYHHASHLSPVNRWCREIKSRAGDSNEAKCLVEYKTLVGLVDIYNDETNTDRDRSKIGEAKMKNWPKAYFELLNRIGGYGDRVITAEDLDKYERARNSGYKVGDAWGSYAKTPEKAKLARDEKDSFKKHADKIKSEVGCEYDFSTDYNFLSKVME